MPVATIPDRIETAAEARDLILDHLRVSSDPMFMWKPSVQKPLDLARSVLLGLDGDPGPGPVVRTSPAVGESTLVGVAKMPPGREVLSLPIPAPGARRPDDRPIPQRGPVVPIALAEVVSGVGITFALAARCRALADAETTRAKQGKWWRAEANALDDLALDLEARIPDLGDEFLDELRARGGISPAPSPVSRPVSLR